METMDEKRVMHLWTVSVWFLEGGEQHHHGGIRVGLMADQFREGFSEAALKATVQGHYGPAARLGSFRYDGTVLIQPR